MWNLPRVWYSLAITNSACLRIVSVYLHLKCTPDTYSEVYLNKPFYLSEFVNSWYSKLGYRGDCWKWYQTVLLITNSFKIISGAKHGGTIPVTQEDRGSRPVWARKVSETPSQWISQAWWIMSISQLCVGGGDYVHCQRLAPAPKDRPYLKQNKTKTKN
jgi:hypothetical protein